MRPLESGSPLGYVKKPTKGDFVVDDERELVLELDDEEEDMGAIKSPLELSPRLVGGIPEQRGL